VLPSVGLKGQLQRLWSPLARCRDGDRYSTHDVWQHLRIQGWIGDLALTVEQELFAEDSLKVKLRQQYGAQFDGFAVEEALRRLREQLLPLFERVNRQLLQNLQALQRPPRGTFPTVAINRAANVSIAERQLNIQRGGSHASQPVTPR
jgi:hypothetical protein